MTFNYNFTELAQKDLLSVLKYISSELKNETASLNLAKQVFEYIDKICSFPEMFEVVDNDYVKLKKHQKIHRVSVESYFLYYLVNNKEKVITILRFVYIPQNQSNVLKNF